MSIENLGQTWKVTVPSSRMWEIRETNGEDDATLSKIADALTGENVNNFIANIIVGPEKPLAKDIIDWPINDKYYLLFKQRLLNLGKTFNFKDIDPTDDKHREVDYEEDISLIDGDLSSPHYKPGPGKVFLYPSGIKTHIEFKTESGKYYRFKIVTGVEETFSKDIPKEQQDVNTMLLVRHLEVGNNGDWQKVLSFLKISSKEMREIRSNVMHYDRQFAPEVMVKNPYTGMLRQFPLLAMPTFFFPEEMKLT